MIGVGRRHEEGLDSEQLPSVTESVWPHFKRWWVDGRLLGGSGKHRYLVMLGIISKRLRNRFLFQAFDLFDG